MLFYNQTFYFDECALISNVINRNLGDLFQPLSYGQVAPPLFLVIEKIFYLIFKNIFPVEVCFRLFPFICSISVLFLIPLFFHKVFNNKYFTWFSIFLVAFNVHCVFYSVCAKQYSLELLVSILLFSFYYFFDLKNFKFKEIFLYSLLISLSFLFSSTAIFIIFTGTIIFLFLGIKNKYEKFLKKFVVYIIPILISFLIYYFGFYKPVCAINSEFLYNYWGNIVPSFFTLENFSKMFSERTMCLMDNFYSINISRFYVFVFCNFVLLLLKRDYKLIFLLGFPLVISIILSFLKIYPYQVRFVLILLPLFIALYLQIFRYIEVKKIYTFIFSFILIFLSVFYVRKDVKEYLIYNSHVREVFNILSEVNPKLQNVIGLDSCYYCYGGKEIVLPLDIWQDFNEKDFETKISNLKKGRYYVYMPVLRYASSYNMDLAEYLFKSDKLKLIEFKQLKGFADNAYYVAIIEI